MSRPLLLTPFFFLLAACTIGSSTLEDNSNTSSSAPMDSAASSSDDTIRETKNVTYQGTIAPAGISIYQQGSHRLLLPDERFILLESSVVDLNGYVGELAEVTGSIRPTVEAGGIIMRVEKIALLGSSDSVESAGEEAIAVSSLASSAEEQPSSIPPPPVQSSASALPPPPPPPALSSSSIAMIDRGTPSPEFLERTALMARHSVSADQWTQNYCTGHIGFCVPIHRNWYYKSFGATTGSLWHVEASSEEIDSPGDGPIRIDLLAGNAASKKAIDGQVREQGDTVIGFKDWSENRHFEISAPKELQEAVQYMIRTIATYTES
ncbi:MAG: hypothetical protein V1926_04620 [Candidatus Peregrinibacteria bacterium]